MQSITLLLSAALLAHMALAIPAELAAGKNCCCCDASIPAQVCRPRPKDQSCICTLAYCPFDEQKEKHCCCCNPGIPAIVCRAIPKDQHCMCTAVACPITWDPPINGPVFP